MHQEGSELRRSHKQNEVGGLPLPLLQPNIFIGLEKKHCTVQAQLSTSDCHSPLQTQQECFLSGQKYFAGDR